MAVLLRKEAPRHPISEKRRRLWRRGHDQLVSCGTSRLKQETESDEMFSMRLLARQYAIEQP